MDKEGRERVFYARAQHQVREVEHTSREVVALARHLNTLAV